MEAPDWSFTWSRPRFASAVSGRPPPCPSGWHWSSWNHHSSSHLWPQWPRSWIYQEQGPQNEHSVHPVSKHVIKIYNKISVKMKYQRITIFLCIWFPFMLFITLSISVPSLCPSFSLFSGISLLSSHSLSISLSLSLSLLTRVLSPEYSVADRVVTWNWNLSCVWSLYVSDCSGGVSVMAGAPAVKGNNSVKLSFTQLITRSFKQTF